MGNSNVKKAMQLGMPHGTASGRLKKIIIFQLLKELNRNFCYQCGLEIGSEKELSVEHKEPWLDSKNPKKLFFDLDNIAFSHLSCNIAAAKRPQTLTGLDDPRLTHGVLSMYNNRGCRCDQCTEIKRVANKSRL